MNHPFLMVGIPPINMVMAGGWFIISIPTLSEFDSMVPWATHEFQMVLTVNKLAAGLVNFGTRRSEAFLV